MREPGPITSFLLQAAADETTSQSLKQDYGNLAFCGVFLLGVIGVAIWWLRRG